MANLTFRISSALKNIIGGDLITDEYIAVFELVKNSYDAHAKQVVITFEKDKIIITDDGKGMDYNDLLNKWLFVAYSAKKEGIEDKELNENRFRNYRNEIRPKRYFAGAKGIGRFSCDRLGHTLKLTTKKAGISSQIEQLLIDWEKFEENPKENFIDIQVNYRKLTKTQYPNFKHGTILEISVLKTKWTTKKKLELKHSLEKLINPFEILDRKGKAKKEQFSIIINDKSEEERDNQYSDPRDKVNGKIGNFIFETLNVKTTQIITIVTPESIFTELIDRGETIYQIKEKNLDFKFLKNVKFHLFYLNQAAKFNFKLKMGVSSHNFGSVFLYKNGFRIYPYGEPGEDIFNIDTRKAQGVWRYLGTRDLLGRIEITDEKEVFRETTSRDGGLIKTESYEQLRHSFVERCLLRLEKYVVDIQWSLKDKSENLDKINSIQAKEKIIELVSDLAGNKNIELVNYNKSFLTIIKDKLETDTTPVFNKLKLLALKTKDGNFAKQIIKAERQYNKLITAEIKARNKAADEEEKRLQIEKQLLIEKEKNTFLRATSTGPNEDAQGLIHNIKHTSKNIKSSVKSLVFKIKSQKYTEKDLLDKLQVINFNNEKVLKISKIITRANFKADANSQILDIPKYVVQYINIYNVIYDKIKLDFEIKNRDFTFIKRISALDISLILDDLISNAHKARARKIMIEMKKLNNNKLKIVFADSGTGVIKRFLDNPESMFELGVTTTEDGSGIGLYTVRKTLKEMHGEIKFIGNNKILKGATFEIIISK